MTSAARNLDDDRYLDLDDSVDGVENANDVGNQAECDMVNAEIAAKEAAKVDPRVYWCLTLRDLAKRGAGSVQGAANAIIRGDLDKARGRVVLLACQAKGELKDELKALAVAMGVPELDSAILVFDAEHPQLGHCLRVEAPFSPALNAGLKTHKVKNRWESGKRKDPYLKCYVPRGRYVAKGHALGLFRALKGAFKGRIVVGSKGIKTL